MDTNYKRKKIPSRLRFKILRRDNFTCQYCGKTAKTNQLHVDHIIPVSKGGRTHYSNLITACIDCNLGKSNEVEIVPLNTFNPLTCFNSTISKDKECFVDLTVLDNVEQECICVSEEHENSEGEYNQYLSELDISGDIFELKLEEDDKNRLNLESLKTKKYSDDPLKAYYELTIDHLKSFGTSDDNHNKYTQKLEEYYNAKFIEKDIEKEERLSHEIEMLCNMIFKKLGNECYPEINLSFDSNLPIKNILPSIKQTRKPTFLEKTKTYLKSMICKEA